MSLERENKKRAGPALGQGPGAQWEEPGLWCQLDVDSNLRLVSRGLTLWLGQFSDFIKPQSPHFSNGKPHYHLPGVTVPCSLWRVPWRSASSPPTEHRGKGYPGERTEAYLFPQQSDQRHFCRHNLLAAAADPPQSPPSPFPPCGHGHAPAPRSLSSWLSLPHWVVV